MLKFDNRFVQSLPGDANASNHPRQVHGALWSRVVPTPVAAPRLLAYSPEVASMLGLSEAQMRSADMVAALSGTGVLAGMHTYATAYGGHQFGNWAGQLGDGRAILLGEAVTSNGRFELQLKGAGRTPFSRGADGRAVLRSSIREFLCSEAMHHLGVPTTRALSLVATGDDVERDMFYDGNAALEPGAIVCRVAPTFIRFGHFELLASRNDSALLRQLVDFTITHYFAEIAKAYADENERIVAWFADVCVRTAKLVAEWMRAGFVHGVMNTDNMSITGLTIDYGPYGWVDDFDPGWTPNTTDASGKRYAFGRQPGVAHWNLARLGDALATLGVDVASLRAALEKYESTYGVAINRVYSEKFGLYQWQDAEGDVMDAAFSMLMESEIDMTIFFRALAAAEDVDAIKDAFYLDGQWQPARDKWAAWFVRYRALIAEQNPSPTQLAARVKRMNAANPKYVLRNYLAQQAIDAAHGGDYSKIDELLDVMRKPYVDQPGREAFAMKRPDWARTKAGCSMLSCSS